jgi:hypothetical protein
MVNLLAMGLLEDLPISLFVVLPSLCVNCRPVIAPVPHVNQLNNQLNAKTIYNE